MPGNAFYGNSNTSTKSLYLRQGACAPPTPTATRAPTTPDPPSSTRADRGLLRLGRRCGHGVECRLRRLRRSCRLRRLRLLIIADEALEPPVGDKHLRLKRHSRLRVGVVLLEPLSDDGSFVGEAVDLRPDGSACEAARAVWR